jgi:hypothetical protein
VLERGSGLISRGIRTVEGGEYSHALIFLGNTDFLEAVGIGARVISYVRVPISDPLDWIVLRHPDPQIAQHAADKARNLAHKEYGTAAALRSKTPFPLRGDPTSIFCSQLVAEAFERAGETLVKGKHPSQVTPKLLHENSTLKPLQAIPVRELIDRNIPALDRDVEYVDSAPAQELNASQSAFKAVESELGNLMRLLEVTPRPGSLIELFDFLMQAEAKGAQREVTPVMQSLERALDDQSYFDLFFPLARDAEAALWRDQEFAVSEQAGSLERKYLARQSNELAVAYGKTLSRFETNAQRFQEAFEKSGAPLWSRLAQMNREIAQETRRLIEIARTVSEKCRSMSPD